jgi:hypothetical protein
MGRPITRISAPARCASAGVITRFWSARSAPDEEKIRTAGPTDAGNFVSRTDDAIKAGLFGEFGQAHDLVGGGAALTDRVDYGVVDTGENRDAKHFYLGVDSARGLSGVPHHPLAARDVDVEHRRAEPGEFARGGCDCVGYVVELHVREHRQTKVRDPTDAVRTDGGDEFQTNF